VFDVTIPVAGIDTRNAKRDKHLQSPDFFNEKIGTTTVASLRIRHQLNRNDYGVGTGSWAATAVVGDEVNIEILMELHR
jgi:polyisoprenoid-binding protein YceI